MGVGDFGGWGLGLDPCWRYSKDLELSLGFAWALEKEEESDFC